MLTKKEKRKKVYKIKVRKFFLELKKLGFNSYSAYLSSDYWKENRRRYWASKLPKECYVCERKDGLHLHHRKYNTNLVRTPLHHLVLVCEKHHKRIHTLQKKHYFSSRGVTKMVHKEYKRQKRIRQQIVKSVRP